MLKADVAIVLEALEWYAECREELADNNDDSSVGNLRDAARARKETIRMLLARPTVDIPASLVD